MRRLYRDILVVVALLCVTWSASGLTFEQRRLMLRRTQAERDSVEEQKRLEPEGRKSVGLVLSGGGAKGAAHIAAIKVIEKAGIPIDYITGTSMGAIIGGLYAIGYDTYTLDSMVRTQNWIELIADKVERRNLTYTEKEHTEKYFLTVPLTPQNKIVGKGLVGGHNVFNLLTELTIGYHDSISFRDLPIPFACVAFDIAKGNSVVLDRGYLAQAIRASMSIPGVFEPVEVDSMLLVDGGIVNNFPVDVIKAMGADIVIGVDVGATVRDGKHIKGLADLFNQITYFTGEAAFKENKAMVDLYVAPRMNPYTAGSFSAEAIDSLLVRGEEGMRGSWDELIALKEKIGIATDYYPPHRDTIELEPNIKIKHIIYNGSEYVKLKTLERASRLKEYSILTPYEIQQAVGRLQGLGSLSQVQYYLDGEEEPYNLIFNLKDATRNTISLGFRFDSEEMGAILLNSTYAPKRMKYSHFDLTARLSESPYLKVGYTMGNVVERKFSLSYMFKYNKMSLYNKGKKWSNFDFMRHTIDLSYSNIPWQNLQLSFGLKYEFFDYQSQLTVFETNRVKVPSSGFINYYAEAKFETLDRRYNPHRGQALTVDFTLYTSDFITYKGDSPYSAIHLDYLLAIPASNRLTILPGVFSRVLIGENSAFATKNFVGGLYPGRYMDQQLPFVGIGKIELMDDSIIGARLDFRFRFGRSNYFSFKTNYARTSHKFMELDQGEDLFGLGISYSYNTVVGPIEAQIDWTNHGDRFGFYFGLGYYF